MTSRFDIPHVVAEHLSFKDCEVKSITGYELTRVFENVKALRLKQGPLVTVAIPAHNEEENLFATLRSLSLQETNCAVEIIVIDNNSSDRTSEIAEKCGVRVLRESTPGVALARQLGLKEAKGEVVATGDADTVYPPNWLQLLVDPLLHNSSVSCTYSLHCLYDERGEYRLSHFVYQYAKLLFVWMRSFQRGQLNAGGASMAFRREQALFVGGYNLELSRGEDGYLALFLSQFGKVKLVANKAACIYTSNRRMLKDGSAFRAFTIRARYGLKHFFSFFSKQQIPGT